MIAPTVEKESLYILPGISKYQISNLGKNKTEKLVNTMFIQKIIHVYKKFFLFMFRLLHCITVT